MVMSKWYSPRLMTMANIDPFHFTPKEVAYPLFIPVWFGKLICWIGVREGKFLKNKDHTYSIAKHEL